MDIKHWEHKNVAENGKCEDGGAVHVKPGLHWGAEDGREFVVVVYGRDIKGTSAGCTVFFDDNDEVEAFLSERDA